MKNNLNVAGLGMVSALGVGAAFNAAAMRCHYDGFIKQQGFSTDNETLLCAPAPLDATYRGGQRLAQMMALAANEALEEHPRIPPIPFYLCLSPLDRWIGHGDRLSADFITLVKDTALDKAIDYKRSIAFFQGRTAFAHACIEAQQVLEQGKAPFVLVVAVASLLSPPFINYFESQNRLLKEGNADGFIPGEAAVALLLTQRDIAPTTVMLGVSLGKEANTIEGNQPVTGDGLTHAVRAAAEASGIPISNTDFRLTTASGESYFFRELSIVHGRTLENPRQDHPLWHPADSLGEVGSVLAPAMVVMAHYAFKKGYAPGKQAICQISNDNDERAALVLHYQETAP